MTSFYKVLFAVVTVAGLCWNGTAVAQQLEKTNPGFRDDISFLKQHTEIVTPVSYTHLTLPTILLV